MMMNERGQMLPLFYCRMQETGDGSLSPYSDNSRSFLKKETENRPLSPLLDKRLPNHKNFSIYYL